jgi:hypothetical protein
MSFFSFSFLYKIREQKGRTSPDCGGWYWWEGGGGGEMVKMGEKGKCYVHIYVNGKMIPFETIPGNGS